MNLKCLNFFTVQFSHKIIFPWRQQEYLIKTKEFGKKELLEWYFFSSKNHRSYLTEYIKNNPSRDLSIVYIYDNKMFGLYKNLGKGRLFTIIERI